MALTANQLALTKLYLASFNRAPETSGLNFWSGQLASGKSFADVVSTVFGLPVVKAIYPDSMSNAAFLAAIYSNIFGKTADAEGLAFWTKQLEGGQDRSSLVMTMIDAGLGSPDGTPGKAFVVNRFESAKQAVEKQITQGVEIAPAKLAEIMSSVNASASSLTVATTKLDQYSGAKINGVVADGYIKNATVFADKNGDGIWNEGEAKTTTDANGNFILTNAKGNIVVTGGTDISTNLAHTGVLTAPEGSKVVNPLTALQQALVQQGKSAAEAQAAVIKAFGLTAGVSLQDYDPLATAFSSTATAVEKAAAVKFQSAAAKVQNLLVTASKTLVGAAGAGATATDATHAVLASLASSIVKDIDGVVSLADTSLLKAVLTDSAANSSNTAIKAAATTVSNMSTNFATILSESAAKVDSAVSSNGSNTLLAIAQMAQVQTATQGTVAGQMQTAAENGSLSSVVSSATGSALTSLVNNTVIGDLDPNSTTDSSVIGTVNGGGDASGGGGGGGTTPTFTVTESGGSVSFGGTATGTITMTIAANGTASFSRSAVTATTTVSDIGSKVIASNASTPLTVAFNGTASADTLTLNAPHATDITLQGNLDAGSDKVVLKVADIAGEGQRSLKLITTGLSATGDRLKFDFVDANDTVVLAAGSVITGFSTFEVKSGTVDINLASLPPGMAVEINSGMVLSVAQLKSLSAVSSSTGNGGLKVTISSPDEVAQLQGFLATAKGFFRGVTTAVDPASSFTPSTEQLAALDEAVANASAKTVQLDTLAGLPQSPTLYDAGTDALIFKDLIATTSFARVTNFGADDSIVFTGSQNGVSFATGGGNVIITANDGHGHISEIVLVGVGTPAIGSLNGFNARADLGDVSFIG